MCLLGIISDSHQHDLAAIVLQYGRGIPLFHLPDCSLGRLVPFQLHHQRRKRGSALWQGYHIRDSFSGGKLLHLQVLVYGSNVRELDYIPQCLFVIIVGLGWGNPV